MEFKIFRLREKINLRNERYYVISIHNWLQAMILPSRNFNDEKSAQLFLPQWSVVFHLFRNRSLANREREELVGLEEALKKARQAQELTERHVANRSAHKRLTIFWHISSCPTLLSLNFLSFEQISIQNMIFGWVHYDFLGVIRFNMFHTSVTTEGEFSVRLASGSFMGRLFILCILEVTGISPFHKISFLYVF